MASSRVPAPLTSRLLAPVVRTVPVAVVVVALISACNATPSPTAPAVSLVACTVTVGRSGTHPPAVVGDPSVLPVPWVDTWYGNDAIWIRLPRQGTLPAFADAGTTTISTKFPWWRVLAGPLTVSARPVDGGTNHFVADVGTVGGYGPTGFVPSGLTFDHPGCWEITGSLDGRELSFLANIVVLAEPSSPN